MVLILELRLLGKFWLFWYICLCNDCVVDMEFCISFFNWVNFVVSWCLRWLMWFCNWFVVLWFCCLILVILLCSCLDFFFVVLLLCIIMLIMRICGLEYVCLVYFNCKLFMYIFFILRVWFLWVNCIFFYFVIKDVICFVLIERSVCVFCGLWIVWLVGKGMN